MFCIFCQNKNTEVIETRLSEDGTRVRRRRRCLRCKKRFTTYERVETFPILVIKRDKRREKFDRDKLRNGLIKSCGKTKVSSKQMEEIISATEAELRQKNINEVKSQEIGKIIARKLKKIDKVAYIRFASVFKRFVDLEDFEKELNKLL